MKQFRRMAAALCAVFLLCGFVIPAYTYGGVYPQDIAVLQKDYADLWWPLSDLLEKLTQVVEM